MKEDEESAPRTTSGADKGRKRKSTSHIHIGPYARAYRAGLAFCPVCDAEKVLRLTEKEKEAERVAKDAALADRRKTY